MKKWIVAVALLMIGLNAQANPQEYVQEKYQEIRDVIAKNPKKEATQAGIRKMMEQFVDYQELSRRALPDKWEGMKKKEQKAFVDEFKKMIQRTYVRRFDPETEFDIEYLGVDTKDDQATVKSLIRSGRSEVRVDYHLHQVKKQWWAYDVVIDEVSMVLNYRKQFHNLWNKSGYKGLMDRLKTNNAAAEQES